MYEELHRVTYIVVVYFINSLDIWLFNISARDNICAPGRLTGQYGITDAILAARLQRRLCDTGAGEKLKLDLNAN